MIVGSAAGGQDSAHEAARGLHLIAASGAHSGADRRARPPARARRHAQGGLLFGHGGRALRRRHHGPGHAQYQPHRHRSRGPPFRQRGTIP